MARGVPQKVITESELQVPPKQSFFVYAVGLQTGDRRKKSRELARRAIMRPMTTRLLIADAFPEARLADLRALGLDVDYQPELTADTLASAAKNAAILVVRSTKVTRAALEAATALALVIRAGASCRHDRRRRGEQKRRVLVANSCPGKNSDAVVEAPRWGCSSRPTDASSTARST